MNRDKLEEIWTMQAELNQKIGVPDPEGLSDNDKIQWILNYSRAMGQEVAELTDSVPWKWWAKYQKFDKQNVAVELVDILHFLVSSFQTLGLDAKDVHRIYCEKHQVNVKRQASGYTKKDHDDCGHIQ